MLRAAMTPQDIPQLWESYPALADGKPGLFMVNMGLVAAAPLPAAPAVYFVTVHMQDPGPDGVGTPEEAERLGAVEDAIAEAAQAAGLHFPGRVRTDGRWELGFYGPTGLDIASVLDSVGHVLADLEIQIGDNEDPEWRYLLDYLAPDRERWQWILDFRVVRQLAEAGDQNEKPRTIDHAAHFRTEADLDAFVASVASVGYVESQRHRGDDADDELPWMVEVQRDDPVTLEHIHAVAMDLIERVEAHDGDYDGWGCPVTP